MELALGQTVCLLMLTPSRAEALVKKGWGQFLAQYLTLPVVNNAVAGTSARSFTTLGLFTTLINEVSSGDFVGVYCGLPDILWWLHT